MNIRAGAAVADLGPDRPVPLFGYPHVQRISTGQHDPLLASTLFLDTGTTGLVLMALDLLFLDPPTARALRRTVAERLGLPEEHVLISCTHTHSGPVTSQILAWHEDPSAPRPDLAYLETVKARVLESALRAAERAEPAELAWTCAHVQGVGSNRLDPAGITDPEAGVLAVRRQKGGPLLALALIYGMHPTVLHEDSTLVSADFPGYTRQHLQECYGAGLTVVYHNGACGNQSPRYTARGHTFAEAERLGRLLGQAVAASVKGIDEKHFRSEVVLSGQLLNVDLPRRPLPSVKHAEQQLDQYQREYQRRQSEEGDSPGTRTAECAVFGAEGTLALARLDATGEIERLLATYRPFAVQAVRIGDVVLVGLPGEIFTEYALDLKHRAPVPAHVVAFVNGELQGYVVTPEAAAQGGYEALTALHSPAAGQVLTDAALQLLRRLADPTASSHPL
jgi:neutral ceramidase